MMKKKSMVAPCRVRIWLYCSPVSRWLLGTASCARMRREKTPARAKAKKAVAVYMRPIFLWSTVVSRSQRTAQTPAFGFAVIAIL